VDATSTSRCSYGANFNPHCHAIISDGVWSDEGEFLELPSLDTAAVCDLFSRLLLRRLHKEERLSGVSWRIFFHGVHPGFLFSPESLSSLKMPGNLSGSRDT